MEKIFLVEDDLNFGSVLKAYLEMNDFNVILVNDGAHAIEQFRIQKFDLCILDVMLPNVDGFTIAKDMKKINPNIPLIFLTAKTLKADVLQGYKTGADDYITKPFDSEVLLYKIRAILNRKRGVTQDDTTEFSIGNCQFDYKKRLIVCNSKEQKLSPKESELLKMLCENKNEVTPRDLVLKKIWGDDNYFTTRSMDVFITKLRKYLRHDSSIEIVNIHGSGYILKE